MTTRKWSPTELALLRELYPDVPAADVAALLDRPVGPVHQAAARYGISKSAAFYASELSSRIQRGRTLPGCVRHQFAPGFTPWNKGLKGWHAPGIERTQFKPGNKPQTWVPVGSYRINSEGYLDLKVADVSGPSRLRWHQVHRLVWEAAHGPIPAGHLVVFKPGHRTTELAKITADILECIDRAEHARRNHPRTKSPELAKLVQLKGAITRQVNRINREHLEKQA